MPFRSPQEIWERALGSLQVQVSPAAYETWLRPTVGLAFDGAEFSVGAPSSFVAEWLQSRMHSLLERTLADVLRHPVRIAIRVDNGSPPELSTSTPPQQNGAQLPLLGQAPNPRFTFETFIVGENSQLAYAAAQAVAQDPGHSYNPFFLYGTPGLGKTHLLHAVTHAAQARREAVLLTTAEQFVNDFVTSLRTGTADGFRARYRSAHLLLIDDIQFICGKPQSEESLYHTCSTLLNAGKQIVLTADRPSQYLPLRHRQLASRLQAGLQVQLRAPDYSARLAILTTKAAQLPLPVSQDVLSLLAARPSLSVRQMEGDLTKAVAIASLLSQPLTLDLASQAISTDTPQTRLPAAPSDILQAVCRCFNLSLADLTGRSRERSIVQARHLAMYVLKTHTPSSLQQIGRVLGGRDHTTVLHGLQRIAVLLPSNPGLQEAHRVILHSLSTS